MNQLPLAAGPAAALTSTFLPCRATLRTLRRANPVLWLTGWLCLGLALPLAAGLLLDSRRVTGAPVWAKPLKFTLSIAAYTWTLGWLLRSLPPAAQRSVHQLSAGAALSMVIEQVLITVQAGRGTTSHYNESTPLNARILAVMGVFVVVVTLMNLWACCLVWRYRPGGPASYAWGIRWGLSLFTLGTLVGGAMGRLGRHTVGAPDGGPGLPLLGWSTRAGDLRIAHFVGIHALQALPLLGWSLRHRQPRWAALLTSAGALAYAALMSVLLKRALHKLPL